MKAVFKHELSLYYHGLLAYVFGAFLLEFIGIGAMMYNINRAVANFEYALGTFSIGFFPKPTPLPRKISSFLFCSSYTSRPLLFKTLMIRYILSFPRSLHFLHPSQCRRSPGSSARTPPDIS